MDIIPKPPFEKPQTYITYNKLADYGIAFIFAFIIPFVRIALVKYAFEPLGTRWLYGRSKKIDSAADQDILLKKWNESCWKATAFTVFTVLAFLVSYKEPWFLDSRYFWTGCTNLPCELYVSRGLLLFYCLETGFYIQSIHFLVFYEIRRKDWLESMMHHVASVGLLVYSYWLGLTRVGVLIMLLHDVCDVWMELAKLCRYLQRQFWAGVWFVIFFITWIVMRLYFYPMHIIRSVLLEVWDVAVPHNINIHPHYEILTGLLFLLFFLHIYWSYLILQILIKQLRDGDAGDIREDDDAD